MKPNLLFLSGVIVCVLAGGFSADAGEIYQNFEPDNGIPVNIWSRTPEGQVAVVDRSDGVHLGQNAARYESGFNWNGLGINRNLFDVQETNHDRLTFWILAFPDVTCYIYGCEKGTDNNVGIEIHDNGIYASNGFTVWTVKKAKYQQWTKLEVFFSQLPPDFDLRHISQIQFINYWPGKYYLDDFHAVREDRVYQSFNAEFRSDSTDADYGWKWNDSDTVTLSGAGEPVYEGSHSWKMVLNGKWGGGGIQSEQQNYFLNPQNNLHEQSFWHNNLRAADNDRLSLWVYALPENAMDNNLNVQIYDHGTHSTDETKAEFWTKIAARHGAWTRLEIPFNKLPVDLNLQDIDKIQIQSYWAGTFYIDDIRATGSHPTINEKELSQGHVTWDEIPEAENYRLLQSFDGPHGPWVTIYSGNKTTAKISGLKKSWLKVRWEENFKDQHSLPYSSPWSDTVEYQPATVNIKFNMLANGLLSFNSIAQTDLYELQMADDVSGPWTRIYKGAVLSSPLTAQADKWYRVRPIKENNGVLSDFASWSRPQVYKVAGTGFVKASGTVLKDQDGHGHELVLTGYNLGNYLLTEDWMTGFGLGDQPPLADDWTIRETLISRFGAAKTQDLFRTFQNAYLNDYDFDLLARANVTLVRLPIFYRNLMDDNGNFILNEQGQIDFSQLDRVVDAMADRGIYTLIDLHGAPGSQSAEMHTGRKDYNKLFENGAAGEIYRTRTELLWKEIAKHYKNNTWVLGYDLLNEPVGVSAQRALANFYDRLYLAIRSIDSHHLIVMEGIWDWNSLPNPADMDWQNVMYQFHYYCPMIAEPQTPSDPVPVLGQSCADYGPMSSRLAYQKAFIDGKIANSLQSIYQVPAMVGEFSVHDDKASWDYYVQTFNAQKWSWTVWSYKDRSSPSNWAILNHANGHESFPKFRATQADGSAGDSFEDLNGKLLKYASADFHVINGTLKELIQKHAVYPQYQTQKPEIFSVNPEAFGSPSTFVIQGRHFGDNPLGSRVSLDGLNLTPIEWSDSEIKVYFPTGQSAGPRRLSVSTAQGTSSGVDVLVVESHATKEVDGIQPNPDGTFTIAGQMMCDTPGTVEFFPSVCHDIPPGTAACNNGNAAITSWSETLIKGYVPPDYAPGSFGGAKIHCQYGGPLYPTMIPENRAPVLDPIANRVVNEGQFLFFSISASDPDADPLTYSAQNLPSGATLIGQIFFWTPDNSQSGDYAVTFRVSDGKLTDEQVVNIKVLNIALPDLIVKELQGPDSALTGSSIAVRNTITNIGQGASGQAARIGIYLSEDPVITISDKRVYSRSINSLKPGWQNTLLSNVKIPSNIPAGTYYLGAIVDYYSFIQESDETNNVMLGNQITIQPGADLVMQVISGPSAVFAGTAMSIQDTVENQGAGSVSKFFVGYYLSEDSIISTADRYIGRRQISSLGVGAVNSSTTTLNVPASLKAGTYYIGAIADYNQKKDEQNENNNSLTGNSLIVTKLIVF